MRERWGRVGHGDRRLKTFLSRRLPPSQSRVTPEFRETTVCYAYMCPYAYACSEKSIRTGPSLDTALHEVPTGVDAARSGPVGPLSGPARQTAGLRR
jgi:hypothetical protein